MNKTILDFNKYPDINLEEFSGWFEKKYFKSTDEINAVPLFMGKYDVEVWFHIDVENNKYSMELKLVDYSEMAIDSMLQEALDDMIKSKEEK